MQFCDGHHPAETRNGAMPPQFNSRDGWVRTMPSGFYTVGHATIDISMNYRKKRAVGHPSLSLGLMALFMAVGLMGVAPSGLFAADLSAKTVKAFNRYVKAAEARMQRERRGNDFLYIDTLPKPQYEEAMSMVEHGGVYVQRIRTRDAKGQRIDIPGGLVNHWVGDILIPNTKLSSALDVLRDYNNFKNIYKPEVVRSRLVSREDDDDYEVYLRLQKKTIVTVTLDTWYNIHFMRVDASRGYSRSISTRIQQVEDAGTPQEHLDPVGHDSGYLWRIDSFWRYEQHGNGVIIEWESIALSRPIPFLIAWFVKPLIRSIARETVQNMLTATQKAVLAEKKKQSASRIDPQLHGFAIPSTMAARSWGILNPAAVKQALISTTQ